MLQDWEINYPGRVESMTKSLQNVVPSHLMDTKIHNFKQTERMFEGRVTHMVSDHADADADADLALLNLSL